MTVHSSPVHAFLDSLLALPIGTGFVLFKRTADKVF